MARSTQRAGPRGDDSPARADISRTQHTRTRSQTGYATLTTLPNADSLAARTVGPSRKYQLKVIAEASTIRLSRTIRAREADGMERPGYNIIPSRANT